MSIGLCNFCRVSCKHFSAPLCWPDFLESTSKSYHYNTHSSPIFENSSASKEPSHHDTRHIKTATQSPLRLTLWTSNLNLGAIHLLRPHRGRGGPAQVDACGRGRGQAPCGRPHRKLKLESTDVIQSSSHTKKLASFFYQNFVFGRNKKWKFLCDRN